MYYDEDRQKYEYLTEEEQIEHNMESESGIMYGDRWGPEDGKPIIPPTEPYPTTEIEDWGNTVSETNSEGISQQEYFEARAESNSDSDKLPEVVEQILEDKDEVADNNEEDDNQVNTDTEDSSDNTDSSDSQDSSDSEDNSSDDGGDSSDSGDDGGDSGDNSESEE